MMEQPGNTLLALLRSALWSRPVEGLTETPDWNKVLTLAKEQTVLGLVSDAIGRMPENLRPSADAMHRLRFHVMRTCQAHAMLNRKLARTVDLLRSHDIHPVLFKGQGLALEYPDPMLRQCGDIDLYVGPDDYLKACRTVLEAYGSDGHESESAKHMHIDSDGVTIELHRIAENLPGPFADRRYQKWTRMNLEHREQRHVDIGGTSVDLPPVDFNVVYVMNHAWHHFMNGGVGLRQFCDWTMFVHNHHKEMDIKQIESDLKSFGLWKAWHLFSSIAVRHLGLPAEECPFYDGRYEAKADRVLEVIWMEGNFGKYAERRKVLRPQGYASGKLHSFRQTTLRYRGLMDICPEYVFKSWNHFFFNGIRYFFTGISRNG